MWEGDMRFEKIKISNFKVLQNTELTRIPPLVALVGRNGTGKSTLFELFGFLKDALTGTVRTALQKRGGYREVVSRGHEGEAITIELKFRIEIVGVKRLVTYVLVIGPGPDHQPVVQREILRYKRGQHGAPFHFLDFSHGEGEAVNNEEDFSKSDEELTREPQKLDRPDILAIKGLGQFERFKAASALRQIIEEWYISDFHITSARGSKDAGHAEHLDETGSNLSLVAQFLYQEHPDIFEKILQAMRERVPGVENVSAETTSDGRLLLRFKDGSLKDPFVDRFVSDGTIKMFAYLVMLHTPRRFPLFCIEEPENQLYPALLILLAEEFRVYAQRGGQVFISTHSPDLVNALDLNELFWLRKENGFTTVHRVADSALMQNLVEQGDGLGDLFRQELFNELGRRPKDGKK